MIPIFWKSPWCWERLGAGGEKDDRGWDGWMASLTQWTWVWVNSGSWWWTGRPGVLGFMGSQRVNTTERLSWTEPLISLSLGHNFLSSEPQIKSQLLTNIIGSGTYHLKNVSEICFLSGVARQMQTWYSHFLVNKLSAM